MYLVEAGPRGRHRRTDPASGLIEAAYVLVPHPLGGYNETAFKAGVGESPRALPYIEINVADGSYTCRRRASGPVEIDKLVSLCEEMLSRKPQKDGLICQVGVRIYELGEIGNDPEFWPRIVLDLKDQLFIRARNPEEAKKFFNALVQYLRLPAFKDYSRLVTGPPIQGSTPHQIMILHDTYQVGRVFAKIVSSFAFVALGNSAKQLPMFRTLRSYALGDLTEGWDGLFQELRLPGSLTHFQDCHVAGIAVRNSHLVGLVSLFGGLGLVDLGEAPVGMQTLRSVGASAEICGKKTKMLSLDESEEVLRVLLDELESVGRTTQI
jgi:hypothetical protein